MESDNEVVVIKEILDKEGITPALGAICELSVIRQQLTNNNDEKLLWLVMIATCEQLMKISIRLDGART